MTTALVCGLTGYLAGCVDTKILVPPPSQVVVHATLDAASADQLVLLERTSVGSTSINGQSPILGAAISITTPSGIVMTAHEDQAGGVNAIKGQYRISLSDYGVTLAPGGRYTLHVRTDRGEEVSGSTVIPNTTAAMLSPPEVFFRKIDTLRLHWSRVEGARSYEVRIQSLYLPDISFTQDAYVVFADTSASIAGVERSVLNNPIFSTDDAYATVSAVDVNYYEYYVAQSDPFLGVPPSHLTGALGVFGSMVPVTRRHLVVH
ncbi:MAG: DUF4249 family protein [bacterium]